jgi:NAD(P)-dependent dehydrogenase (short-subunit alcohol dehydrogenase family)
VVLGDIQTDKVESLAHEAKTFGEGALDEAMVVGPKTNVTSWEDQRKLFEFADKKFGRIDVVVVSAGVTEAPGFDMDSYDCK